MLNNKISNECKFINGEITRPIIERDKFGLFSFTSVKEERQVGPRLENFPQACFPAIACNRGEYREVRESRRVKSRFALARSRDT